MKVASQALSHRAPWLFLLFSLACLALASLAHAETYTVSGRDVAIYNLAGNAVIEPGTSPSVEVVVTRGGRDGAKLKIAQGVAGGRETLRVIYPGNRIHYPRMRGWSSSQIAVGNDGRFDDDKNSHFISRLLGRKVTIQSGPGGEEAYADLVIRIPSGRTTSVYVGVGTTTAHNIDGELMVSTDDGDCSAMEMRGKVNLDTGSGAVKAEGVEGDLLVDTGSGDVTVARIHGTSVSLDTGSGEVEGASLQATKLHVDTGSGSIRLGAVSSGDVFLDTGSGDVALAMTSDVDRLKIDTGSGSVRLQLVPTTGAHVHVNTGSGGVDCNLPMSIETKDDDTLIGTLGDGRGSISIDTGSGSVRLASVGGKAAVGTKITSASDSRGPY